MLKAEKKVLGELTKCYSLAHVVDEGKDYLVCAAEKTDPCYMFDYEGNLVKKLWDGPGGVMTLEQFPSDEFILLATWKFYGPNDSKEAKIVYYTKDGDELKCNVLCDLPFVHRFGLVNRNGVNYIVACTLKSAHAFKNDWTCPGRIWVGELPNDIHQFNEENQLELTPLVSGLFRNHGFCKGKDDGYDFAVVGSDQGVMKVIPPQEKGGEWSVETLLKINTSDMLYEDFDGDGERELLVMSPFHGDTLEIYHLNNGKYEKVYEHPEKLPFLHAIYPCEINGKKYGIIGNREGDRVLFAIYYDENKKDYAIDLLDEGAGPANAMFYKDGEKNMVMAANRETNEIAIYELKGE